MANESTKFVLGDKMYAFGRQAVQLYIPALSAAYFALANIWNFPNPEKVCGSCAILATFLGVVLKVSTTQYNKSDKAYDGTVTVTPHESGSKININVDPFDLIDKTSIRLKRVDPPSGP